MMMSNWYPSMRVQRDLFLVVYVMVWWCRRQSPKGGWGGREDLIRVLPNTRAKQMQRYLDKLESARFMSSEYRSKTRNVWCREHGVFPTELEKWRISATTAQAEPEDVRASPQATQADKKRIKELERELQRKDMTLGDSDTRPDRGGMCPVADCRVHVIIDQIDQRLPVAVSLQSMGWRYLREMTLMSCHNGQI